MLDNYLLVKTNPKASKENIILWHDYRITVLFDRLLRIEKSIEKKFRDNATQSFLFRNTNKQDFSVVRDVERLEIKTCKITLTIKDNFDDSFVVVDNHKEKIDNSQNLKGTYCTLDCCDGKRLIKFDCTYLQHKEVTDEVNLGYGVCSKNGVAVIDDSTSLSIDENGHIIEEIADGFDIYLFAYGDDYKGAVRDFYKISGECPLVPRFALGNWWSRYHIYTDKEYMQILNKFEEEKVPLTVATIDMD